MEGCKRASRRLLIMILIFASRITGAAGVMHVHRNGEDSGHCGNTTAMPCRTVTQTVLNAAENDVIYVHASGNAGAVSWYCENDALSINKSLTFSGYGGVAHFGCPQMDERMLMFNISRSAGEVKFHNTHFTRALFYVEQGSVEFSASSLLDSQWYSLDSSPWVRLALYHTTWEGNADKNCTIMCSPTAILHVTGLNVHLELEDSTFYQTSLNVTCTGLLVFEITRCVFSNRLDEDLVLGGIELAAKDEAQASKITVRDTLFEYQVYNHPIDSIKNLYEAALLVLVGTRPYGPHAFVEVLIDNCTFSNNERGLTFIGPYKYVNVTNCLFVDNIAMHAGAGILYLIQIENPSQVINCTFEGNAAGSFKPEKVLSHQDSFQVNGDEVRIHSPCCKGVISFVGKGGAIRIQKGSLALTGCTFRNNTARLLGGAVFVDRDTNLVVDDTEFANSNINQHALQGDLIYSNGIVSIKSARLEAVTAKTHVAVLRHSGDHWSIEVTDVAIQCPVGFRLRVTNTSAYGVTAIGLRRSYKLDQLSYFCESCARNKYSLDYGYLNYSLQYNSFDYFTLLINGQKPQQAYTGTYFYHDIKCEQCPYGGKCQQGITAVANFWGYIQGNQVKFQHCPKGYCCASTDCHGFDTCAEHRGGVLCGECIDGYSEALFSSGCVTDDQCDPTWIWPVAIGSGLLYFLFLLFQKDIRDMMFMKSVSPKDIAWPCRSQRHSVPAEEQDVRENSLLDQRTAFSNMDGCQRQAEQTEMQTLNGRALDSGFDQTVFEEDEEEQENNNTKSDGEDGDEDMAAGNQPPVDTGASFLIILFYYFQDAQLLHIKTVFASAENPSRSMLKEILAGLFKFRVELFQFMDKLCFFSDISPSMKLLIKVLLVPYVLFQFGMTYLGYRWWKTIRGTATQQPSLPPSGGVEEEEEADLEAGPQKTFSSRLATGFVLSLLFTYQMLATTSFKLLNCVPVGDVNVLFIEGTITCYQAWQYGVMAYAGSCISPFCLALLIGPGLLKNGLISLPQFFSALIFPLPFLFYWLIIRLHLRGRRPSAETVELSAESQAVISILQGPFKDSESRLFGPICGQGILIGRRLVLILLFTFVNDTLIRMLCMMLVCFIILLHHVHALPYKDTRCNLAGSASAAALVIVGGINLVRAGFEAAEYTPQGPNMMLMIVFDELENSLMLWFPAAVMGLVFLSLTVKLVLLFLKKIFA